MLQCGIPRKRTHRRHYGSRASHAPYRMKLAASRVLCVPHARHGGHEGGIRQPPYLCPVCEAKVAHAIVGELQGGRNEEKGVRMREICRALQDFCARLREVEMETAMCRGLESWVEARLEMLR